VSAALKSILAVLLAGAAVAQRLDAELLVAHPAHLSGDSAAYRAALYTALAAEPDHPLVPLAVHQLSGSLDGFSAAAELPRLTALAAELVDAEARFVLATVIEREVARRLFADERPALPAGHAVLGQAAHGFFGGWYAVGPFGALDHPAPAAQPAPADSPEVHRGPDREDYGALGASPRVWRRCPSAGPLGAFVWPSAAVHPSGGVTYAAAVVAPQAPVAGGRAVLELRTSGAVRAWWNGQLCVSEVGATLAERATERFRCDVPVRPGPNVLLVRVVTEEGPALAARLLAPGGSRVIPVKDLPGAPWEHRTALDSADTVRPMPLLDLTAVGGALQPALAQLQALVQRRPDEALAVPPPPEEHALARVAWAHGRLVALDLSTHLPEEVERRQTLELLDQLERDAARAGVPVPALARRTRASRLLAEDRPREALAQVEAWLADSPRSFGAAANRVGVLQRLDREGVLAREALEALVRTHPERAAAHSALAGARRRVGDEVGALDAAWAALQRDADAEGAFDLVAAFAARSGDFERLEWLLARIEHAVAQRPESTERDSARLDLLEYLGREGERLRILEQRAAAAPHQPDLHWRVGNARLALGDVDGARAAFARELELDPADPTTRETLRLLGEPDAAARFFAQFAPDVADALARAEEVRDTSVVEALDSGLVYYFPDGSSQARFQTLSIPRDRSGTEALHVHEVEEGARVARVLTRAGRELEPVEVDGEWTLPALEPGDVVEFVWERFAAGRYGALPEESGWRFSSFEKAFPTSRWVVYVPNDLPGRLALVNFEGERREVPYEGGTVHILTASYPRFSDEPMRPSDVEVLPMAGYSGDRALDGTLLSWEVLMSGLADIPRDLEPELAQELAQELTQELTQWSGEQRKDSLRGTAEALYNALDRRIGEHRGDARAAFVWASRRGWPLFLLGALYTRAGVPFEWAVLARPFGPELDPVPVELFVNGRPLDRAALRLGIVDEAGEPIWIVPTGAPGFRFGAIPEAMAGAPVFVRGADGWRTEALPRHQLASAWDADVDVEYTLAEDGGARVQGTFSVTTAQGDTLRRQLREAPAERREAFARQRVGAVVRGLDVATAEFLLDDPAPGLKLAFTGALPRCAVPRGAEWQADPPYLPLGLDTGFGAAERRWPLAVRAPLRVRVRATVVYDPQWAFLGGPLPVDEGRPGQRFRLALDSSTEGRLVLEQEYTQRGMWVPPGEMGAFSTRMGELEAELRRPLRWRRGP